jgi:hypothetical protein
VGVARRANQRLRELGYRRAEAAVVTVADDPGWVLLRGTLVRAAAAPKEEVLPLVERLPTRAEALRARTS